MNVIKRDGRSEPVSFDKVLHRIQKLSLGLKNVNTTKVAQKVLTEIVDGITTTKLDEVAGEIAAMMITIHPDYGQLAANLVISNLQKNCPKTFKEAMTILHPIVSDKILAIVNTPEYATRIEDSIVRDRDFIFDYFGFKTLERAYLLRKNNKIIETPQYMWMRVSLGIHNTDIEAAIKTYKLMSQGYFTHATPTLFNSGTPRPQLSSCFLTAVKDDGDSVIGMYDSVKECALISKYSGGIGIHTSNIRAKGSHISGTNGKSSGLIPYLRVLNNTALHINQGGKRNGSIAVYLEPWHSDVEDFLMLKRNTGAEEERARDLFLALWIPDLFMERVEADLDWSLMCPSECPGLADCYGDDFKRLYESYESQGTARKKVPARQLWFLILESQIETGVPYLLAKDSVNSHNNQDNLGVIKSSNLCVAPETLILTDKGSFPISHLVDQKVNVWNGNQWSETTVRKTGENQKLLKITLSKANIGYYLAGKYHSDKEEIILYCTPYHKFILPTHRDISQCERIEAKYLSPGLMLKCYSSKTVCNDPETGKPIISDIPTNEASVVKVEDFGRYDDTYCFTEPINNAGVFNGILTGNCAEITEYSDKKETAVCNLASVALPKFVEDGKFNFGKLRSVVETMTINLNRIIDINFYPVPETEVSNLRNRPIGIGVQGLADTYAILKMPFDSPEAAKLNREIFENMYWAAANASMELAKMDGHYTTFPDSPASFGYLQPDLWKDSPSATDYLDWNGLRTEIARTGMRNSLLIALMPTASTSQILGNNECFEPFTSNLYVRRVLAGEFVVINKYLVRDLEEVGLWNPDIQNAIMAANGRVKDISAIPQEIRDRYKTVWDIKQKVLIDQARDRAPFVCQSQSMNLFFEKPSMDILSTAHFYSWKKGLKTLSYYIRSKPKAQNKAFVAEGCLTCSA